ncbi:23S rRNA (adenine(2503)-C(2))-methyltransferase RlmN [Culicoidibacter larvae]|uniref:Probable dual-specificity RNA methyltransferase RlmN n=1 Tax=Culicoidibacter larvae TaxID=2579976 RepID=A0A5R8QF16_9FIRM|nr:23S rRNA (adenine(2503)-C(2))-methyltransferase RlmN [Culicoidibacter larvae]TLG75269.1 23S rRNA (adenine(2503)-C(2))-methyltransferase RlmN [Culicoidibacter larvae]
MSEKTSIYSLSFEMLEAWLVDHGQKKFRAQQIWQWLYRERVRDFAEMTNISKDLIATLNEQFWLSSLELSVAQVAKDGTRKYLFRLADGNLIETVLMKQEYGLSICVTTQVGCNIGCSFCASGLLRKQRDLNAGEIVEQIMQVQWALDDAGREERVSHVVIMGIGEPFDNYKNVMTFIRIINHPKGLAIGARHITVSTSGLAKKIRQFADEGIQVNLALSLHAPNNELRSRIMKINNNYPVEVLMDAVRYYMEQTNRRVTFEYIMLNGVNDQPAQARELADLIGNYRHLVYVNLIPYNPVSEHDMYQRSEQKTVLAFYDVLKKANVNVVIRKEHGTEIDAACGQLRSKQMKKERE